MEKEQDPVKLFNDKVAKTMADFKVERPVAVKSVSRANPELHRKFIEATQGR